VNFGNAGRLLSPLLGATFARSLPIVRMLLDHGADPNAAYDYELPLLAAVSNRLEEIALLLLDRGARPGANELWTAVYYRMNRLTKKLVEKGAEIDDEVPAGTPLTAAVDNGDVEMVQYLLARGADPEAETNHSQGSPIHHAEHDHRKRILAMLLAARDKLASHR